MRMIMHQGKKTAVMNIFIDPERGFLDISLDEKNGGVLYVPQGEEVSGVMGQIIAGSKGALFVLGQDYHPRNHISFMRNHPGVMEYRFAQYKALAQTHGMPVLASDVESRVQWPVFHTHSDIVPFPFNEIVLDEKRNIIGLKEADGRVRQVQVETTSGLAPGEKDRGRVTKVLDTFFDKTFDAMRADGRLLSTQTLWTTHCVQGTASCLYPDDMGLPKGLTDKLEGDFMSPFIYHRDAETGNEFYVIRKGANSEVDSYGIGVENDGKTLTAAWEVFSDIAERLKMQGCEQVIINGGGLATNFCTEFSLNNVVDFLAGHFKMRGMGVDVNFLPEISRGIPVPGDASIPFSLAGTPERLKARGVGEATVADVLHMQAQPRPAGLKVTFKP